MKQFAVIGLGRFGMSVAQTLSKKGVQVLAIDMDEKKVKIASEFAARAIELDATDETALRDAGVPDVDVAVVGIGRNIASSILITLILKEFEIKTIIAKAFTSLQGKVLTKLGASRVIYPEREMGAKVTESLIKPGIFEHIKLSPTHTLVEVDVPKNFEEKTIGELAIRSKYRVQVVAIKRKVTKVDKNGKAGIGENILIAPMPDDGLIKGDRLVLLGQNEDIERVKKIK
ncbi:TrkA family potassium uptake protein [candidate division WOR-3 bacterium]|nr:TrkA family potassium uptake protein [candidate division WOR-3 bacterium]